MEQQPKPAAVSSGVTDEPALTDQELKCLAQFLDVLMEVDFCLNRKHEEVTDD